MLSSKCVVWGSKKSRVMKKKKEQVDYYVV